MLYLLDYYILATPAAFRPTTQSLEEKSRAIEGQLAGCADLEQMRAILDGQVAEIKEFVGEKCLVQAGWWTDTRRVAVLNARRRRRTRGERRGAVRRRRRGIGSGGCL